MRDIRQPSETRRLTLALKEAQQTIADCQKAISDMVEAGRVKHKSMREQINILKTDKFNLTEELNNLKATLKVETPPLPCSASVSHSEQATVSAAINWHL
jgi:hypothetical protein